MSALHLFMFVFMICAAERNKTAEGELAGDVVSTRRWMLSGFMTSKFGGNKFSPGRNDRARVGVPPAVIVRAGRRAGVDRDNVAGRTVK